MTNILLSFAILGWALFVVSVLLALFKLKIEKTEVDILHDRYKDGLTRCTADVTMWETEAKKYKMLAIELGYRETFQ